MYVHIGFFSKLDRLLVQLFLVALPLLLSLKPLTALGVFALVGVLGDVGFLLRLVLLRVSRLLMILEFRWGHAAPPDVLVQTYHALVPVLPSMTLLNMVFELRF